MGGLEVINLTLTALSPVNDQPSLMVRRLVGTQNRSGCGSNDLLEIEPWPSARVDSAIWFALLRRH
jgi:hypothetical protein